LTSKCTNVDSITLYVYIVTSLGTILSYLPYHENVPTMGTRIHKYKVSI